MHWVTGETYQQTVGRYVNYVRAKYGNASIVFDRYDKTGTIKEDAGTIIAKEALEAAKILTIATDDTDVLMLLIRHLQEEMKELYFCSEKAGKTWKVQDIIESIDAVVKKHILFLHVWSGCNTTSASYGHGKTGLVKKIGKSQGLQRLSDIFCDLWAEKSDIRHAGHIGSS